VSAVAGKMGGFIQIWKLAFAARGGLNASRPRLMDFLRRIHARPAYQRAIEHGGKYAF